MSLLLRERDAHLKEFMDDPDCDLDLLHATYKQFQTVNKLLGGWHQIYKSHIRPALSAAGDDATLLDIGCGGGDILSLLDSFCRRDNLTVHFTGIEPDVRAIHYVEKQEWPENFTFLNTTSHELVQQNSAYTVIISNHLVHHLSAAELNQVCSDAEKLAQTKVIFSDIERSAIGYMCFKTIAPLLFRNSFIVADGVRSIRRSYKKDELDQRLPNTWSVRRQFPFRLLAIYDGENS